MKLNFLSKLKGKFVRYYFQENFKNNNTNTKKNKIEIAKVGH